MGERGEQGPCWVMGLWNRNMAVALVPLKLDMQRDMPLYLVKYQRSQMDGESKKSSHNNEARYT